MRQKLEKNQIEIETQFNSLGIEIFFIKTLLIYYILNKKSNMKV